MWDRIRRRAWGLSGRLTASYVLVTLAVVVLTEALVLGYEAPRLVSDTRLNSEAIATAKDYGTELAANFYMKHASFRTSTAPPPPASPPGGHGQPTVSTSASLYQRGGKPVKLPATGDLTVPAIKGPVGGDHALTAVVAIAPDGTIIASSAPARYPPGRTSDGLIPAGAAGAAKDRYSGTTRSETIEAGSAPTRYGGVDWAVDVEFAPQAEPFGKGEPMEHGLFAVYAQVPQPPEFISPVSAWDELRQRADAGPLLTASYVLLAVIVPVGVLFGLLASRRLVRRIRRLEAATLAVADGDYTIALPASGRDEIGRLEANFAAMTGQLRSALAAERDRASGDARNAERIRIAREVHDAISQHLFGLRMIVGGMRRVSPDNEQVAAVERITEDALRDVQALLLELRPAGLDGTGLAPALHGLCASYHDRLGVTIDENLEDVAVGGTAGHALLRIAQEACANAVRHGHAQRLAVSLTRRDEHVELAVRDTGTGFDPADDHHGSGLANIRDRVAELGGTVDIVSAPGAGTTVTVRVPAP